MLDAEDTKLSRTFKNFNSRGNKGKIHEHAHPVGLEKFPGKGDLGVSLKIVVKCQWGKEEK